MCRPPDVSAPAHVPTARRRDVSAAAWAADPPSYENCGAPPAQARSSWPSWIDLYQQNGYVKDDSSVIEAAPLGSLLASALGQQKVARTWQPQPNWAAPQSNSYFRSPQGMLSSYGGAMDPTAALLQSSQCSGYDMGVSAPTNSLMAPSNTFMALHEQKQSSIAPLHRMNSLDRPKEEEKSTILFEEFVQESRLEQDVTAKRSGSKLVRTSSQKAKQSTRPAVKKDNQKDVYMDLVSDIDGTDEDGEGVPVISEKRRKRMLSNRASAQRSRQRRQERLDTLEVLVAQLRVQNDALTRKANSAVASVKRLEEENRVLRERLESKEQVAGRPQDHISLHKEGADDSHSLQTTGNTPFSDEAGKVQGTTSVAIKSLSEESGSSENRDPNAMHQASAPSSNNINNNNNTSNSRTSMKSKRASEDSLGKDWSYNSSFGSIMDPDVMDSTVKVTPKSSKQNLVHRAGPDYSQQDEQAVAKAMAINVPQTPAYQELEPFDIDLDQGLEIDKRLLDSVWGMDTFVPDNYVL